MTASGMNGSRGDAAWERYMGQERAALRERESGRLARSLGPPLPWEDPEEISRTIAEDEEQARLGLVRMERPDGSAYLVGLDALTPGNRPDRLRAERGRLAWIRGRLRDSPVGGARMGGTLTRRQREVLTLAARGMSNRGISGALRLSDATIKRHLANAYAKLDVRSRTQAVRAAQEQGLIPPSGPSGDGLPVQPSGGRWRCALVGCGREVAVERESADPTSRGEPPACHGRPMVPMVPTGGLVEGPRDGLASGRGHALTL